MGADAYISLGEEAANVDVEFITVILHTVADERRGLISSQSFGGTVAADGDWKLCPRLLLEDGFFERCSAALRRALFFSYRAVLKSSAHGL